MTHADIAMRLRTTSTLRIAAVLLPMLVFAMPQGAAAMSAFAAGIPDDVARQGVALGEGHNYSSRDAAEERALLECRTNKGASDEVHALCKIVDHFDDRCFAGAVDPKAGTPGWGWSIADTLNEARDQALAMCRQSAGEDRSPYCVVEQMVCDGAANSSK